MARKRHRRHHRFNPAGALSAVRSGFQPRTLLTYAPVAGGALANIWLSELIANRLPSGWQTGLRRVVVNIGSAGLLGAITAMVAKKYARQAFVGGMLHSAVAALTPYVGPQMDKIVNAVAPLPAPPVAAARAPGVRGLLGMGDFLDTGTPRLGALDELGCCSGTGEPEEAPEMTV